MICGVDEAGRGPVMGPLVVAGVAVASDGLLRDLHVRDSKKLTPERRQGLAPEIEKIARHALRVVPAEDIDTMRAEMSLNELEASLFASVISELRPDTAYVDAVDVDPLDFKRAIEREVSIPVEIVAEHDADERYPVVSAASILAKVRRDREMRDIEKALGERIGSGYPSDPVTLAFLEKWIREKGSLPPHTRASWDTARRLLGESRTRKLDEFDGGSR